MPIVPGVPLAAIFRTRSCVACSLVITHLFRYSGGDLDWDLLAVLLRNLVAISLFGDLLTVGVRDMGALLLRNLLTVLTVHSGAQGLGDLMTGLFRDIRAGFLWL